MEWHRAVPKDERTRRAAKAVSVVAPSERGDRLAVERRSARVAVFRLLRPLVAVTLGAVRGAVGAFVARRRAVPKDERAHRAAQAVSVVAPSERGDELAVERLFARVAHLATSHSVARDAQKSAIAADRGRSRAGREVRRAVCAHAAHCVEEVLRVDGEAALAKPHELTACSAETSTFVANLWRSGDFCWWRSIVYTATGAGRG